MSTSTLLVRCAGPMQSWGTHSRFGQRDTEREPTKSGVCGLLAAALGRERHEHLDDLAALRMMVRIDRPGQLQSDYQTAGGGSWRGESYGVSKASGASPETNVSRRYFLADADFLVALQGPTALIDALYAALESPRWPLFLGRRGYAPGLPPWIPGGLVQLEPLEALRSHSWPMQKGQAVPALDCVVECTSDEHGDLRRDVPVSFVPRNRRYGERRVRRITLTPLEV